MSADDQLKDKEKDGVKISCNGPRSILLMLYELLLMILLITFINHFLSPNQQSGIHCLII